MKKALLMAPAASMLERFCKVNLEVLQEQGYELHLAANFEPENGKQPEYDFRREAENGGIIFHPIEFERQSFFRNRKKLKELKTLLQMEQFDLIHAHTETGGLLLRLAARSAGGAKLVFTPHGMSFYRGSSLLSQLFYRPIEKWICKRCSAVIAINQEELQVLKRWNEQTAFFTHGIGVDITPAPTIDVPQKRRELGIPPDAVLVTSLGELNRRKNHIACIRAISKIGNPNLYYLICGEGGLRNTLLREAETLGIGGRVVLPGFRSDVPDILACSDIFALPSHQEGLSVALMEAMAAGLPVVCSRIRGNVDLIDAEGGFLVGPDDAEGYARAIDALAASPELREKLGGHNQEAVRQYSKEIVKGELIDVYSGLLTES